VTACAATIGDSYCSLAFGSRLAREAGENAAASVIGGRTPALAPEERALLRWARRVSRDPSATTQEEVDALGATPDAELAARVPAAVRSACTSGPPIDSAPDAPPDAR
jgi:hypothetical protein